MYDCHVHSLDECCIPESIRVYHRLFLLHRQKHVYARLYGTSRFPDHWYWISAFLFLLEFLLPLYYHRSRRRMGDHFCLFPLKVFSRALHDPWIFPSVIFLHTKGPVHVQLFFAFFAVCTCFHMSRIHKDLIGVHQFKFHAVF